MRDDAEDRQFRKLSDAGYFAQYPSCSGRSLRNSLTPRFHDIEEIGVKKIEGLGPEHGVETPKP